MTKAARHIRLEEVDHNRTVRFLSGLHVSLEQGKTTSVVTITRTGKFNDPRYGEFAITREMLLAMVSNFDQRVYGQDIFIDVAHNSAGGAAGKIVKLMVEGDRLRAQVEWTPYGVSAVKEKGYQYLSAEYHENWKDNETGAKHGPVLMGAGLTVRPVVKRLDPIQLSEQGGGGHPTLLHPELLKTLTEEIHQMKDKFLKLLLAELAAIAALTDPMRKVLSDGLAAALEGITEEARAKILLDSFTDAGKQLAEQIKAAAPGATINLSVGGGVSPDDVKRLLAEADTARAATTKQLADAKAANVKIFNDLLTAATGLTDAARKQLSEAADLITAEMSADQVRRLAEHQIKMGDSMAVNSQLSGLGYHGAQGSPRIPRGDDNTVKSLQETVDKRLGLLDMSDSRRYARTGGQLQEVNKKFAEKVLAEYDAANGPRLHAEHKMLAAGSGSVSDVAIPAVFERTVIREALYNLVGLNFVDAGTLPFSATALIPYSYRDTSAAGRGNTRKYEGQPISRAGVIQTSEEARPIPQKLSFLFSDEMRLLVGNGQLDYDILADNALNAARIIGEDTEKLLLDEILNANDEFGAVAVTTETLTAAANGTNRIFVLANFPVVRPRRIFDMKGAQVGNTINPIVVNYGGTPRNEYDGTGTQVSGTYYVLDYNLGEIYFVSELGAIITPPNTTAITVAYSRVTNVHAFNTDPGSVAVDAHWDTFLYRYSLRKTVIEDSRAHIANFGLMRGAVMDQISQARQFGANSKRPGTDLALDGNLGRVKDVPNFKAFAPGLAIADQRVIIGERSTTRMRMMKVWALEQLENARDPSTGMLTGQKEAYGTQWLVVHTPTQLKNSYTSMVLFSAAARVNRAA